MKGNKARLISEKNRAEASFADRGGTGLSLQVGLFFSTFGSLDTVIAILLRAAAERASCTVALHWRGPHIHCSSGGGRSFLFLRVAALGTSNKPQQRTKQPAQDYWNPTCQPWWSRADSEVEVEEVKEADLICRFNKRSD